MMTTTALRGALQTAEHANEHHHHIEVLAHYAAAGPDEIGRRLEQLDREWDRERALEAGAAVAVLTGVALGATLDRRFLVLPVVAGGLLLLNAVLGWGRPVPLVPRLGRRTAAEINEERYALKALRGDFDDLRALTPDDDRADVARFEGEGGVVVEPGESGAHDQHDRAAAHEAFQAARQ